MNHSRQKSFMILESTKKYHYEVIKIISYPTGQSHTQKIIASFSFLYLKAIIFVHADNVGNGLFKTLSYFFSSYFFYLSSSSFSIERLALSFFLFAFSSFSLGCCLCSFSSYLFCAHCSCPQHPAALAPWERLPLIDFVKFKTSSGFIPQ